MSYKETSFSKLLEQLADMKSEVEEIRERVQKLREEIDKMDSKGFMVTDSVSCGKRGKKPLGTVKITGFPVPYYQSRKLSLERRIHHLAEKEQELLEIVTEVEERIEKIEDSRVRRILAFRYIENLSWIQVAHKIGGRATADSCRNAIDRFFQKR